MRLRFLVMAAWIAFAVIGVWKSIDSAPGDAWGSAMRVKLLTAEARDNPGHKILDPVKLEHGIEEHLPTPEPPAPAQVITTSWPDGPLNNALGTPHGETEPAMDWLGRHFSMVELARNYRR